MNFDDNEWVTLQEAAELIGKSVQTVRRMIKQGKLTSERVKTPQGFHYLVRRAGLGSSAKTPTKTGKMVMENESGMLSESPIQMLPDSPIQNKDLALVNQEKRVLTNQSDFLTNQNSIELHIDAENEGVDKKSLEMSEQWLKTLEKHHEEKMALINILEKLQTELDAERKRPRSFLGHVMDWFTKR